MKKLILLAALAAAAAVLSSPAEARHPAKPAHHVTTPRHPSPKPVTGKHASRLHGTPRHTPPKHVVPKHPAPKRAPVKPSAPAIPAPPIDATPKLSDFADLVFDGIVGENAPQLDLDFTPGIAIGSMPLAFEKTKLGDIQALYGGTLHTQGEAGTGVTWLCYTQHAATRKDTPVTAWFTSTNEKTDTLGMIVVENVDASRTGGCTTVPANFSFPAFGIPATGASLPQLRAKFGPLTRDRQGNVYLNSTRPLNDGTGQSVYQTLGYLMSRSGTVLGIAVTQVTTH